MNLFIDTSALVKLYHQEDGSENLADFLKQYEVDLVITISDLSKIEFHSAFLKRVRMNEIDEQTVKEAFEEFENDTIMMNIVDTDLQVKNAAISLLDNIAVTKSLKTLDALQLATAILTNQFYPIDYFIAADKKLLEIAQTYFQVYNPIASTE